MGFSVKKDWKQKYILGIDFGTDSVRVLVINPFEGHELGSNVVYYPRWAKGLYCDPRSQRFRQHPLDYLESLEKAVRGALRNAVRLTRDHQLARKVVALGVDTTASTPVAVDRDGTPLALKKEWAANPNAMFILWKDHTAVAEAERINKVARSHQMDYTRSSGGVYSSEWFFSKILHVLKTDSKIRRAAFSWVEHCDWIVGLLIGKTQPGTLLRNRSAAGHKAMWHDSWNGLPSQNFLSKVDHLLDGIRDRLFSSTVTSDHCAGTLSPEWARRLGLTPSVRVAVGGIDAHVGAVGAGIRPGILCKVIGTSTCDMVVVRKKSIGKKIVSGICGQVDGSILPGYVGLEAGQSSAGDAFAWLRNLIYWGVASAMEGNPKAKEKKLRALIFKALERESQRLSVGETGLVALDWLNGRRTPYADQTLRGAFVGMGLGTGFPALYRSLVEAVAFGARKIMDQFHAKGVKINSIIATGGLSKHDSVMQIHSDVLGKTINVVASDHTSARGAAIFAAVAAGIYRSVEEAQKKMSAGFSKAFKPNKQHHQIYQRLYKIYSRTGQGLEPMMKELVRIQNFAR